jgi:hypothetical protein
MSAGFQELLAGKPAGPGMSTKESGAQSVYSDIPVCTMMYHPLWIQNWEKCGTKLRNQIICWYVLCTNRYTLAFDTESIYLVHTFCLKYVPVHTLYKKVCTIDCKRFHVLHLGNLRQNVHSELVEHPIIWILNIQIAVTSNIITRMILLVVEHTTWKKTTQI